MASHSYLPGFVFHPELRRCSSSKDSQAFWQSFGARKELQRSNSIIISPHHFKEAWKPMGGQLLEDIHYVKIDSSDVWRPVIINVQGTWPGSVLLSFGIAKSGTRHKKILQFLTSGTSEGSGGVLDISMLSEFLELQSLSVSAQSTLDYESCCCKLGFENSFSYPPSEYFSQKPLLDFAGDSACSSKVMGHGSQMKDLLSVGKFYISENTTAWRKKPYLVPYFTRSNRSKAQASKSTVEAVKAASRKSPEKIKSKPSQKKKTGRKTGKERDLYEKNSFHACEDLLSLMMDSRRHTPVFIRKSGPEVPHLLTQFSAGLAGTGLAVLFSVVCKVAYGRAPLCAPRLFSTGIGLGLVWLSGAVSCLQGTIASINKVGGRPRLDDEEEMARKLEKGVNEIFFRAAALMAVVLLRLV